MKRRVMTLLLAVFGMAGVLHAQTPDPAQLRAWLDVMPYGQPLQVTLKSGEVLDGTFAEAEENRFGMWVEPSDDANLQVRGAKAVKQWIAYEGVAALSAEGIEVAPTEHSLADHLRAGDKARVHTSTGELLKGRIEVFEGDTIRIRDRTLSLSDGDVVSVDVKDHDPLWNGTLVGLGVGAVFAGLIATSCDDPDCGEVIPYAAGFFIATGAGIGLLADALRTSYTTIYVGADSDYKLTFAPLLTRDKKGVLVTFSF